MDLNRHDGVSFPVTPLVILHVYKINAQAVILPIYVVEVNSTCACGMTN